MSWFITHPWQAVSMSHVRSSRYLWVCFHAVLQKHVSQIHAKQATLERVLYLCSGSPVSLQGINEKYSSLGPKGEDAWERKTWFTAAYPQQSFQWVLHLFENFPKWVRGVPEAAGSVWLGMGGEGGVRQVLVPASAGLHMEQKQFGQCGCYKNQF